MSNIKLQSSDGVMFDVEAKIAECLNIKNKVEDLGTEGEKEEIVVKLPNVNSEILTKIIEWVTYHNKNDSLSPPEDSDDRDDINTWNANFVKELDKNIFVNLMLAAYEFKIEKLVYATCTYIANMMKGKTTEEMREMFQIENDLTPEEIKTLREECSWFE